MRQILTVRDAIYDESLISNNLHFFSLLRVELRRTPVAKTKIKPMYPVLSFSDNFFPVPPRLLEVLNPFARVWC